MVSPVSIDYESRQMLPDRFFDLTGQGSKDQMILVAETQRVGGLVGGEGEVMVQGFWGSRVSEGAGILGSKASGRTGLLGI